MTMDSNSVQNSCALIGYKSIDELPDNISRQFDYGHTGNIFSSIDWFSCMSQYGYCERPALHLLACVDDRQAHEATYLLCLCENVRRRRLTSLTNYYTIRYSGIASSAEPSDNELRTIVSTIKNRHPAWSDIELRYLLISDPATIHLSSLFARAGYKVDLFHQHWNWYVNVDGLSYADYYAERPARIRNTLQRKANKVARSYIVRYEHYCMANGLEVGLADYLDVYERSWKRPENPPNFVPELIRLCSRLGILRLGILYLDDNAVAAQFWICSNKTSIIYKLAHDPQYDAFSVGSLLTARMFEQAIDADQVAEIDFGLGDEAYKRDWTNAKRQVVGLRAINSRTIRGFLVFLQMLLRDTLRSLGLRKYTPVWLDRPQSGESRIQ